MYYGGGGGNGDVVGGFATDCVCVYERKYAIVINVVASPVGK